MKVQRLGLSVEASRGRESGGRVQVSVKRTNDSVRTQDSVRRTGNSDRRSQDF